MGGQLTVDKRRRRQCLHTSYENMQMIFNKFVDLVSRSSNIKLTFLSDSAN